MTSAIVLNDTATHVSVCVPAQKRLNATEALAHEYLEELADPTDEPECHSTFDFSYETPVAMRSDTAVRALVFDEISKLQHIRARRRAPCA